MMIFGQRDFRNTHSPVKESQNFIWVAEYYDGAFLSEYNFDDRKSNDYYAIDRNKLLRFGLIGMGSQMYFDAANGIFNINNNRIQVSYIVDGQEIPLTGRTFLYNDIIQYKKAFGDANLSAHSSNGGRMKNHIQSHAIGYKKTMNILNVNIHFKNILHIPQSKNLLPYLEIKISAEQDLNGELIFRVNGLTANRFQAPLIKNTAGIYNWELI